MRTFEDARQALLAAGWTDAEIMAALSEVRFQRLDLDGAFEAVPELTLGGQSYALGPDGRYRFHPSPRAFVPLDVSGDGRVLIVDAVTGQVREKSAPITPGTAGTARHD